MQRIAFLLMLAIITVAGCKDKTSQDTKTETTIAKVPAGPETCKRDAPTDKDFLTIAVIPKGTTHSFWNAVEAGARKAEAELDGVEIRWQGPLKEDDREDQLKVIDDFINAKVDAIVVAPLDSRAPLQRLAEARKAGIEVAIFDSALEATACTDYASFVATDNYVGGQKAARRLGELLDGKGKVLMMPYQVGSASTMKREQGFVDAIDDEFPGITIVSKDQYAGATQGEAQNKADSLLQIHPNIDGIFTPNESTTIGMLVALDQAGKAGKLKFVGFDSKDVLVQAMRDGKLHGLVVQDPMNMGYMGVKTIVAYLRGEEVKTWIDTGCTMATPDNMDAPDVQRVLSPPTK